VDQEGALFRLPLARRPSPGRSFLARSHGGGLSLGGRSPHERNSLKQKALLLSGLLWLVEAHSPERAGPEQQRRQPTKKKSGRRRVFFFEAFPSESTPGFARSSSCDRALGVQEVTEFFLAALLPGTPGAYFPGLFCHNRQNSMFLWSQTRRLFCLPSKERAVDLRELPQSKIT
jgi:hypothetical protein